MTPLTNEMNVEKNDGENPAACKVVTVSSRRSKGMQDLSERRERG